LFPTEEEKEKLKLHMDQYRWYYNATLSVVFNSSEKEELIDQKKLSKTKVRDKMRKYRFHEEHKDGKVFKQFIYEEDKKSVPKPEWWEKVHNRVPRGASDKFVGNINSLITNYRNKNVTKFNMHYMTRKTPNEYMYLEDQGYDKFINKIKSHYWYRKPKASHGNKRTKVSYNDIKKDGCIEIIHEKETDRYFLHYPVDQEWFPEDDVRNDSQVKYKFQGDRIISLDPGIRKFLVGYDPSGSTVFIGQGANTTLIQLLYEIDKTGDSYYLWKRVKNLVDELHWKTISFLVKNYDHIILPEFRTQQMLRSRKISKQTKRLMTMYSFHKFKERLLFKCNQYNKKLYIVGEEYTSKTCTNCGVLNDTKGKEHLECSSCSTSIDRDINGSRNIFIKNVGLK
jgi:transposase